MNYRQYYEFTGEISNGILLIDEDGHQVASIPPCVGNRYWDAYLVWLDQGNSPLPPESVSG